MTVSYPKIGVVIPAYLETDLHVDYLKQSVNSVLSQNYKGEINLIVVVNGGGKGVETEIAKTIGVPVAFYKYKLSAAVARNIGASLLSQNQCEYLCFLDADDIWIESKLDRQLTSMRDACVDYSFTQAFCIDSFGNVVSDYPMPNDGFTNEDIKRILPHTNILINSSSMIKTEAFFKCGMYSPTNEYGISFGSRHLNNKGNICEDYLLWFNSITKGYKFHKVNEKLVGYRLSTSVER